MDTPEELHAFVTGISEVLCPLPPWFTPPTRVPKNEDDYPDKVILKEYHYYLFGRAMGVIAWLIIAKLIQIAFW